MNSLQVECFFAAAECLNFTKAASRLFISQAALSRNIAALEHELGVTLFYRGSKSVKLLQAGVIMLDALRTVEAEMAEAIKEARAVSQNTKGELSVGSLDGQMLDNSLIQAMGEFELHFKESTVHMIRGSYRELITGVLGCSLDMVEIPHFCIKHLRGLLWKTTCTLDTRMVVPKNHPLADKPIVHLWDFKKDTFIILDEKEIKGSKAIIRKMCRSAGFDPIIRIVADISTQQLEIECGKGVCAINSNHMMYKNPNVRGVRVHELLPERFVLAWNEENQNPLIPEMAGILSRIQENHTNL